MLKKNAIVKFLLLFLLLKAGNLSAQALLKTESEARKAEGSIAAQENSIGKVKTLLELSQWYLDHNSDPLAMPQKTVYFAQQSLKLSQKLGYAEGIAKSNLKLSVISQANHEYLKGKEYALKAIAGFTQLNLQDDLGESWVMVWSNSILNGLPYDKRNVILDKAEAAFHKAGNKNREADCLKEKSDVVLIIGKRNGEAIVMLKKALALYRQGKKDRLYWIYDLIGLGYAKIGKTKEAIHYGRLAAETAIEAGDTDALCTIYNRLGIAYEDLPQSDSARSCFSRSLRIAIRANDPSSIAQVTLNYAINLSRAKKPKEALDLISDISKKYPSCLKELEPRIQCVFLEMHVKLHQFDKAAAYKDILEKIITRYNKEDDLVELPACYNEVINFYTETGNLEKANYYCDGFKTLCGKLKNNAYYSMYDLRKFKIDSTAGDYLSAINHYRRYRDYCEVVFDHKRKDEVAQLSILYQTEKKDRNIQTLKKQSALQQNNLKQAHHIQYYSFGMLLLLCILIIVMYKGYQLKQKANKVLEKKQQEINQKNISLEHLVTEKEWLLKEIHHRVKNNLHMVVGLLASQTEFIKSKEAFEAISDSQHRIQSMSLIHQKLYQSESLSMLDMQSYILELTEYLKDSFNLGKSVRFKLDIDNVDLPLSHTIPIGLILNEAVTNAIKYAFPDKTGMIGISLKVIQPGKYVLLIWDNGVGLPPDFDPDNNPTLGIRLMRGLSEDLHGDFKIANDSGTKITLAFSIMSEAADDDSTVS